MSSLMKDWITPTALDELSNAYETLRLNYVAGETYQNPPYDCTPAAVTVHLTQGRRVQLIEVSTVFQRFHSSQELSADHGSSTGQATTLSTLYSPMAQLKSGQPLLSNVLPNLEIPRTLRKIHLERS
jgi:hypothetical protein